MGDIRSVRAKARLLASKLLKTVSLQSGLSFHFVIHSRASRHDIRLPSSSGESDGPGYPPSGLTLARRRLHAICYRPAKYWLAAVNGLPGSSRWRVPGTGQVFAFVGVGKMNSVNSQANVIPSNTADIGPETE